jgi:hypothetical protein
MPEVLGLDSSHFEAIRADLLEPYVRSGSRAPAQTGVRSTVWTREVS